MNILNKKTYITDSALETRGLGRKLSKVLKPGQRVFLKGELGAGKTTFVKGIAEGLGGRRPVRSPSFVVINEYPSKRLKLYHIDLYRLPSCEIDDLGIEEYLYSEGVCLIEWAEKLHSGIKPDYKVVFKWLGDNKRSISLIPLKAAGQ